MLPNLRRVAGKSIFRATPLLAMGAILLTAVGCSSNVGASTSVPDSSAVGQQQNMSSESSMADTETSPSEEPAESSAGGQSSPTEAAEPLALSVGYLPNVQAGALIAIANQQNLWKKYNIAINLVKFNDGPTQVQAMAGGQIDVGFLGPGALWLPASGKAVGFIVDSLTTSSDVMITKNSITSIADIRGKKVGYAQGTSGQMLLDLALRKAGLTMNDINAVVLPYSQITTAYLSGTIQVALPNIAGRETILSKDKDSHAITTDSDYSPDVVFPQMWVTTPAFYKEQRAALVAFAKVFAEANDYRVQNLDQAEQLAASADKAPLAQEKTQAGGTEFLPTTKINSMQTSGEVYKWMGPLQELFVENKQLTKPVSAESFIDTTILADAVQGQ